jgi:hypothetical protein
MNLIEINLSGTNKETVKSLCEALSRRFLGCTLYKTIGYWSEEGYIFKKSYEGITEEEGYGIKVLIEEDLDQVEKIIRTYLSDTEVRWVQVVSYQVDTHHVNLRGS